MAKTKKKTAKKAAPKKTTKKKVAQKKLAKDRGGFSLNWGEKLDWFKSEARRLGMSGSSLIRRAVEEFVEKNSDDKNNGEEK